MKRIKDLANRTPEEGSLKDYEDARAKNLQEGIWACHCGSRKFHLLQQQENVRTICVKCGETDIIYWNGNRDSAKGAMRRLDTNTWVRPRFSQELTID